MQPTYLRLIGSMTFALAFVFTAGLHFYIARVRVSLAELPSAVQVNLQCRSAVPALLPPLRGPPPDARQVARLTVACGRTYQMLFGGLSCSIVFIVAANLLEWRLDYTELWTCIGCALARAPCHSLLAPRPAAPRGLGRGKGLARRRGERERTAGGREGGREGRRER